MPPTQKLQIVRNGDLFDDVLAGIAPIGITTDEQLAEQPPEKRGRLIWSEIGKLEDCYLALVGLENATLMKKKEPMLVASSYINSLGRFAVENNLTDRIIPGPRRSGKTEGAIGYLPGVELIYELVETGKTLRQHGLKELMRGPNIILGTVMSLD